ncbi:hypothetical protein M5D96_014255, partial [Drosophila gunungcola]
ESCPIPSDLTAARDETLKHNKKTQLTSICTNKKIKIYTYLPQMRL